MSLSFDVTILVHGIVGHVHVTLADYLTFDTTKVERLLFRVVLDNFDDREAVYHEKMGIRAFPNSTSGKSDVVARKRVSYSIW